MCFVVVDVSATAADCAERFSWGPFQTFTADVPDAHYCDWSGQKITEVALGMARRVQVELSHMKAGRDPIADYQATYGTGLQHLGIGCRDRDAALRHLETHGAVLNDLNEYGGIRIAFVDVPTGPAMFELLQPIHDGQPDGPELARRRFVGRAGTAERELIEPDLASGSDGAGPYTPHLARGDHGLVRAGGLATPAEPAGAAIECEWLETGERFALHDWAGGTRALQVRASA